MPPGQIGFRCVLCLSAVPLAECRLLHCCECIPLLFFPLPISFILDHGFCDGCMRDWLESNRIGPQRRLRKLHCPTCRKPTRESDLGPMFLETIVLDEDAEYQTRLVNAITEQTNSARDSVRAISPTSGAGQVTRAISGVVHSRVALSASQYAGTEPIVRTVTEVSTISFGARGVLTSSRNYWRSRMTLNAVSGLCLKRWRTKAKRSRPSRRRCVGRHTPGLLPIVFADCAVGKKSPVC